MPRKMNFVRSFQTKGDDGRSYRLDVYDVLEFEATFANEAQGGSWVPAGQLLKVNGNHVNRIEQGKYQIVASGVIIACDDVDAP